MGRRRKDSKLNVTMRKLKEPLLQTLKGKHYMHSGKNSMSRRSIMKANELHAKRAVEPMECFGYRDIWSTGNLATAK